MKIVKVILIACVVLNVCTYVFADRIEDLTAENQQIDQRIQELQTEINESQIEINRLTQIKIFNLGKIEERRMINDETNTLLAPPVPAD